MRKIINIFIITIIIASFLTSNCFAWTPSHEFMCEIDIDNMPEGTVYIDLLSPQYIGTLNNSPL